MSRFPNPIAAQLYTVRKECQQDFVATLRAVAEIGFGAVELAGFNDMPAARLKQELDALALKVAGSHVPLTQIEAEFQQVVDDHHALDCKHVVIPHVGEELRRSVEDWDVLAGRLFDLSDRLKEAGLTLVYHHHAFELEAMDGKAKGDTGTGLPPASAGWTRLFPPAGSSRRLAAEIDVYWARFAGIDPGRLIRQQAGNCPLVHMKDMTAGTERTFAEVGEGILDWVDILNAADEAGVDWLIAEQDECARPALACLETSYRNLKVMLDR